MKSSLIVAVCLLVFPFSGHAERLSLENCAEIEQPAERLACYDKLAGRLPDGTVSEGDAAPGEVGPGAPAPDVILSAPSDVTADVSSAEQAKDAEALFGLEHKQKPEEERPYELRLKWTGKERDAYGKWVITLDNGQVWRQTDSTRFSFRNPEQWVVVSRGFLGSFFLGEPGRNRQIRVERVR